MHTRLSVEEFLQEASFRVLLDVRTPAEFEKGHIPGAINFPIFSNEERAEIGTLYKQVSPEVAFTRGLELVGGRLIDYIKKAHALAPRRKIAIHCWRGGKRSQSMAEFLQTAGFEVVSLIGGYKAYRNFVLEKLQSTALPLLIIGGRTGTGKTAILHALKEKGEQVIDLEGLAHHKGSAFGWLGEEDQPTVEQFENVLWDTICHLDILKRIWVENESRKIGTVFIPDGFWEQKATGVLFNLELSREERIQRLIQDYADYDLGDLLHSFEKIKKRLGGLAFKEAAEAIESGDAAKAAAIGLMYYDKTYDHCITTGKFKQIIDLTITNQPAITAQCLIEKANEIKL
ncbi:MAG: tRNA 2-selenouridine(34) synthase MnmH [Saprospiraceae bacterium]|nr:tRNA 2-selenouridine(34) synthase MnmH [Saprospiraceae bacterium]